MFHSHQKTIKFRNPAQRLPKVQILRAAIARIDQLQKMLYSEDELKTMMKRLDGSASPYPKVCSHKLDGFRWTRSVEPY